MQEALGNGALAREKERIRHFAEREAQQESRRGQARGTMKDASHHFREFSIPNRFGCDGIDGTIPFGIRDRRLFPGLRRSSSYKN